ncbi:MAG: NAD(+)/NADH kinase [Kiritimatiellae bacterium]|nr:NAD(+)/NADH kinase [Kiritimatiellia bacterium]
MKLKIVVSPTVHPLKRRRLHELVSGHPDTECDIIEVPGDGDISEVAKACRSGCERAVAMGGDGTVAAVSQALEGCGVPVAIFPAGTGNLVARELGLPLDLPEAFDLAIDPSAVVTRIDAMRINGRLFLLNAGVGVNADTIDETSRLGKTLFGRTAYAGTALWKILESRRVPLQISVDGESPVGFMATDVLISNCGGLARVLHPNAPDIRPDDGRLDICVASMKSPLEYPWYYLKRWLFPERANRIVKRMSAQKSVLVKCRKPVVAQADGDIIGRGSIQVEVVPKAIGIVDFVRT